MDFLDLPNEILLCILKKLDNINILNALFGLNERLNCLIEKYGFTNILELVSTSSENNAAWIPSEVLNRFCTDILPQTGSSIISLSVEASSMERILLAGNYPNLSELKIFNFNQDIVARYFTDHSVFQGIWKKQIRILTLVISEDISGIFLPNYAKNIYAHIFRFFETLQDLSIMELVDDEYPCLSMRDLPSAMCSSSTLTKLCIKVNHLQDCLSLLDGRLPRLSTFIVRVSDNSDHSSIVHKTDDLRNLQHFSLTWNSVTSEYDGEILPLLRRMSHVKELTLCLELDERSAFVDGTHLHNQILVYLTRLNRFVFYIGSRLMTSDSGRHLSADNIYRTFEAIGYDQVACIVDYMNTSRPLCQVFSLPFAFGSREVSSTGRKLQI